MAMVPESVYIGHLASALYVHVYSELADISQNSHSLSDGIQMNFTSLLSSGERHQIDSRRRDDPQSK